MNFSKFTLKRKRPVNSKYVGNYKTLMKGRGTEFADFRLYEFGDDAKNIDFIRSAQEGKTLIKRFDEEREGSVFFILDINENLDFGEEKKKFETLYDTFSQLSLGAIKSNDKIGMLLLKGNQIEFFPSKKGKENREYFLSKILKSRKETPLLNTDVNVGLEKFLSYKLKNHLVFFISDKVGEIENRFLQILGFYNELIYVNIFDSMESHLEKKNMNYNFIGGGKKGVFSFLNLNKLNEFNFLVSKKIKQFHIQLSKNDIGYVYLDEKKNIIGTFQQYFSQKFY